MRVRVPILKTPNGTTNADLKVEIINQDAGTIIATSDWFASYAASNTWDYVEFDFDDPSLASWDWISLQVRFRGGTATESGKKLYASARVEFTDPGLDIGSEIAIAGVPGSTVENWIDTGWYDDTTFGVWQLYEPDAVFIFLGLNDGSGSSAATFETNAEALATRIRTILPDCHLYFIAPYARLTYGDTYGGEGAEAFNVPGMYGASQAFDNAVFINLARLFPQARILAGVYSKAWSSIAADAYIVKNQVVTHASIRYVCILDHTKSATAPASDATHWTAIGAEGSWSQLEPWADWDNYFQKDGLHPTPPGNVALMQTITTALFGVAAQGSATDAGIVQARSEIAAVPADTWSVDTSGLTTAGTTGAGVVDLLTAAETDIPALIDDLPTVAEFNARTLAAASYASSSAQGTMLGDLTLIKADTDEVQTLLGSGGALSDAIAAIASDAATVAGVVPAGGRLIAAAGDTAVTLDDVEGGSSQPIAPTTVAESRTWHPAPDGWKSGNIVTVKQGAIGTFAILPELNPEADIKTFDSVTVTGAATVTATDLTVRADGRAAHFDLPALTTVGTYTVTPTVTTKDGQTIPMECTLIVR